MSPPKSIRQYLATIGARGGASGKGESKMRGGTAAPERRAYYKRISRKGVRARAAKRRQKG
jgi:hypothetical protein